MGGGPLLHTAAKLEDELHRLAPSDRPVVRFLATATADDAAAVFGSDGFVEAITQRDGASVWRVEPEGRFA